jgi:hypothetical protein
VRRRTLVQNWTTIGYVTNPMQQPISGRMRTASAAAAALTPRSRI